MTDSRWQRIDDLFHAALAQPPEKRDAYVADACGDDDDLRQQVHSLLASDRSAPRFIEDPASETAEAVLAFYKDDLLAGRRVGAYRIERGISHGGMGAVYKAALADDPEAPPVALKLIKPGMNTADVVKRFHAERETLANLDHPNIAKLIDGGVTDEGLPFLVMEFVEGERIDAYCDRQNLNVAERMALFRKVCAAVHYAHQNLVVHRDLKPANILVTADGTPKLLDFGIAKILSPAGKPPTTDYTRTALRIMTPEYASPEHIRGHTITTAADIYSLGVVLYELLTGRRPYALAGRIQNEIERIVSEEVPQKPSIAVRRSDHDADEYEPRSRPSDAVSRTRRTTPQKLSRLLAGDIDTIVLMAMRKEPDRRYASVEQLSEDIRRHLTGLPVIARPDTFGYRAAKFVRRNGLVVAACTIAVVSLIAGVIGTTVSLKRAETARAQLVIEVENARTEAEKANQISAFLQEMLRSVDPESKGPAVTVRVVLDEAAGRIESDLSGYPDVQADVRQTIGEVYGALALYDEAEPLLKAALDARRTLHQGDHPGTVESLTSLGLLKLSNGEFEAAEAYVREALTMALRLPGDHPMLVSEAMLNVGGLAMKRADFASAEAHFRGALRIRVEFLGEEHADVAVCLNNLASALELQGDFYNAERLHRKCLAARRKAFGDTHLSVSRSMNNLAVVLQELGKVPEAESLLLQALDIARLRLGDAHPYIAGSLANLGTLYKSKGDFVAAERMFRETMEMDRTLLGDEHPYIAMDTMNLAGVLSAMGEYDGAESLYHEALHRYRKAFGDSHMHVATALNNLGSLLRKSGRYADAKPVYEEALAIYRDVAGDDHVNVAKAISNLGVLATDLGDYTTAEALLNQSRVSFRRIYGPKHRLIAKTLNSLATVMTKTGDFENAQTLFLRALTMQREVLGKQHPNVATILHARAKMWHAMRRFTEAEEDLRESLAIRERTLPKHHQAIASSRAWLGRVLLDKGDFDECEELLRSARDIKLKSFSAAHWQVAQIGVLLGRCLAATERFDEAEPLLLESFTVIREAKGDDHEITRDALQRIVKLYEAWRKPNQAAEYRAIIPEAFSPPTQVP